MQPTQQYPGIASKVGRPDNQVSRLPKPAATILDSSFTGPLKGKERLSFGTLCTAPTEAELEAEQFQPEARRVGGPQP